MNPEKVKQIQKRVVDALVVVIRELNSEVENFRLVNNLDVLFGADQGKYPNSNERIASSMYSVRKVLSHVPFRDIPTEIPEMLERVQLRLDGDELITYAEAARILRGQSDGPAMNWINDQISRGNLKAYSDPNETDSTKSGRLSRKQVELLRGR